MGDYRDRIGRLSRIMTVVFCLIVFYFMLRYLNYVWTITHLSMEYTYQYFDDDENLCSDTVAINSMDARKIFSLLYYSRIIFDGDNSGFTINNSISIGNTVFKKSFLLQYNHHNIVKSGVLGITREISENDATTLLKILSKYHRFEKILIGG